MICSHVAPKWISLTFCGLFLVAVVQGKIYSRCELAEELVKEHNVSRQQVATWVCIAENESRLNTSAIGSANGDGSHDHGLFQISDIFWCSPPGNGWACGVTCEELRNDDISDDFSCAKRIYREHKQLSGDGFNAWAVYPIFCSGERAQTYIDGCFGDDKTARKISAFLRRFLKIDPSTETIATSTIANL